MMIVRALRRVDSHTSVMAVLPWRTRVEGARLWPGQDPLVLAEDRTVGYSDVVFTPVA